MKIALTDTLKATLQAYVDWVRSGPRGAETLILSPIRNNIADLDGCDGLVLTGGGDIHPRFYGREEAMLLVKSVDESRDEFEFAVIRQALDKGLPILGICRGMQIFNVALGGTLIPDVPTAGYQEHGKDIHAAADRRHGVNLELDTILQEIAGSASGEVNSSHHQAVDAPGRGLKITARSVDGLVEGMQWDRPEGRPFLQLVQWHPERMEDAENPLAGGLLERFAREVRIMKV